MTPTTTQQISEHAAERILERCEGDLFVDMFTDWIRREAEDVRQRFARMVEHRDNEFLLNHNAEWGNKELDNLLVHVAQLAEMARAMEEQR